MNKINLFLAALKHHKKMAFVILLAIVICGLLFVYVASKKQQSQPNEQEITIQTTDANQSTEQESSPHTSFLGQLLENVSQDNEITQIDSQQTEVNSTASAINNSTSTTVTDSIALSTVTPTVSLTLQPTATVTTVSTPTSTSITPTPTSTLKTVPTPTPTFTNPVINESAVTPKVLPITLEDTSTPETIEKAKQFATLKSKCPIVTTDFEIDFSYSDDRFNVFVVLDQEPKFWQWLKENYPALDANSFLLTPLP